MSIGPLMLDLEGTDLSTEERRLLSESAVGGLIFFSRNYSSREQFCDLVGEVAELRPELLLAVDQEGGRVQRLRDGYTRLPPMQRLGDYFSAEPESGAALLRDCGWLMAVEVIASGVDISFAPVLDLDRDHSAVIGDRAFGDDPERVGAAAGHFIAGMAEAGMAGCGKHFPGHGGVVADSHVEMPVDDRGESELRARDMLPFQQLIAELHGIMPAHIVFPAVDSRAVGYSSHWLRNILRNELGFGGAIFSDDLSMEGAAHLPTYAARAEAALAAGCDMVLVCNQRKAAMEVLELLCSRPELSSAESATRLLRMKARQKWDWNELPAHPRWRATREALARW